MSSPRALQGPRSRTYRRPDILDRTRAHRSKLMRTDWVLTGAVLALCAVGSLLVWSATRTALIAHGGDGASYFKKQVLFIAIGLVVALVASMVDYRVLRSYAPFVFGASILGLLAVFAIGTSVHGAKAWINIGGGLSLQPSEFTKIGVVIVLAMLLGEKRDLDTPPTHGDVVRALVVAGIPMGLILLQHDLGTAVVFIAITLGMVAISAAPARWIIGMITALVAGVLVAINFHLLKGYQADRLTSFVNPHSNTQTTGFNGAQARTAIGSGGLTGKGLFHGPQTNGGFVPESHTDFVFSVAGEELGFLGAGAIVVLFGIIMWRGLRIAARSEDMFGRLIAVGVVCWFAFQAFENIGMNMGIMPITGIPLMFVSYGGSSILAALLAIGVLQCVHLQNEASQPGARL